MASLFTLSYHPKEAQLIGSILSGYGEIEFQWVQCLGAAIDDLGVAVRALYRHKGESMRIDVGDALMRPHYARHKLSNHYETALGAIRYCKSVRNQYAHAHWFMAQEFGLTFLDFDKASKTAFGPLEIYQTVVDEPLLRIQFEYFDYTLAHLTYLTSAMELAMGKTPIHKWSVPKRLDQPPLEKHVATPSNPSSTPSGEVPRE